MKKRNKIVSIFMILAVASTMFFAPAKQSQAFLGFGDIVIDIKALAEAILKGIAQSALISANHRFLNRFLSQAQEKLRIQNYLGYARDLADKVYVGYELAKETDREEQYLLRLNSQIQLGKLNPVEVQSRLNALYQRRAITYAKLDQLVADTFTNQSSILSPTEQMALVNLSLLTDPMKSTPQGQRLLTENKASKITNYAQLAAQNNISSGRGYKDTFNCVNRANGSSDSTGRAIALTSCIVSDPANYVVTQVDSKIYAIFNEQEVPLNQAAAMRKYIGNVIGKLLSNAILNKTGLNNLMDDLTR